KTILTPTNLTHYLAVRIKNNQNKKVTSFYELKGINGIQTTVYETQEIKTRSSQNIPDVLAPLTTNAKLEFNPGETKVLILALKSNQKKKSTIHLSLANANG